MNAFSFLKTMKNDNKTNLFLVALMQPITMLALLSPPYNSSDLHFPLPHNLLKQVSPEGILK